MSYLEYIRHVINLFNTTKHINCLCAANHLAAFGESRYEIEYFYRLQNTIEEYCQEYTFITTPLAARKYSFLSDDESNAYRIFILNHIAGKYAKVPYTPYFGD